MVRNVQKNTSRSPEIWKLRSAEGQYDEGEYVGLTGLFIISILSKDDEKILDRGTYDQEGDAGVYAFGDRADRAPNTLSVGVYDGLCAWNAGEEGELLY